jgi:hypothetical protein
MESMQSPTTLTQSGDSRRKEGLMASTYTFTYRVASGATQSFRCLAASDWRALRLFAEECQIVAAVTGAPVNTIVGVEVA